VIALRIDHRGNTWSAFPRERLKQFSELAGVVDTY